MHKRSHGRRRSGPLGASFSSLTTIADLTRDFPSALATAWGSVAAVSSLERFESQQVQAEISHRITIRADTAYAALSAKDRVVLGSRIFDIVTPMDKDGRGRQLQIMALERP